MRNSRRPLGSLAAAPSRLIVGYQWLISPLLPPACRFTPSCSEYARRVFLSRGFVPGLWLAVRRVVRCHPFCSGGYDPPPDPFRRDDLQSSS